MSNSDSNTERYEYFTVYANNELIGIFKTKNSALSYIEDQEKLEGKMYCKYVKSTETNFYFGNLTTDFKLHCENDCKVNSKTKKINVNDDDKSDTTE